MGPGVWLPGGGGVLAGTSGGAVPHAAVELARRDGAPARIAVVLADSGERYVSTPFFAPEPAGAGRSA